MESVLKNKESSELKDASYYGIELKEVDFKEFDRRKAPRADNYDQFVQSLESPPIEVEFIY